jgi:hypothetical protein
MPRRNHSSTKKQGHKTKVHKAKPHPENEQRKPFVVTSNDDSFIAQSLRLTDKRR